MKQYNLFDLVSSLKQSVLSYVCYSLPLGNHTSQSLLGEEFFRRLESDNFRGPFFEAVPSYKKAQSLRELFEPVVSKEPCARKFSDLFRPRYTAEELSSRLSRAGKCTHSIKKHLENDALTRIIHERATDDQEGCREGICGLVSQRQ